MKRVNITDVQFNELSYICDRLKIDWFYPEYFKRKTINLDDLQCIYDNYIDAEDIIFNGEELPQCLKELFQQCEKF